MDSFFQRTDAGGIGEIPAGGIYGVLIIPGTNNDTPPGSYPLTLIIQNGGLQETRQVSAPLAFYSETPLNRIQITGATPNASYQVHTLRSPGERFGAPGGKSRITTTLAAATTPMPAAAPVGAVGYASRPGLGSVTLFPTGGGAGATATLWLQPKAGGTWMTTGIAYPTGQAIEINFAGAAGRFYFQASAAAMTMEIDAHWDVGG